MRRPAVVLGLFLVFCAAACSLRRQVSLPSPYCRGGGALAGVYRPQRLEVKSGPVPMVEGVRRHESGAANFSFSSTGSLVYIPGPVSTSSG